VSTGPFRALGFYDNLTAAADALGFDNLDMAWGIAQVKFADVVSREQFLDALISDSYHEVTDQQNRGTA
jgi:hypothetical protein